MTWIYGADRTGQKEQQLDWERSHRLELGASGEVLLQPAVRS